MTALCACGQPAPDSTICQSCETDLRDILEAIPELAEDLNIAIARLAVFADRVHGYALNTALPFDERAAAAAVDLRMKLAHWADAAGMPLPTVPPMTATAWWLLNHMNVLRQHQAADAMVAELRAAYDHARHVIDRPAPRVYAGPCDCGTDLLTKPGRTLVSCPACGTTYGIAERIEWMRTRLDDHLGSAAYAAAILPGIGVHVTAAMIRGWAFRHQLEVRVIIPARYEGGLPQPQYRLGDIVSLWLAREASRGLAMALQRPVDGRRATNTPGPIPVPAPTPHNAYIRLQRAVLTDLPRTADSDRARVLGRHQKVGVAHRVLEPLHPDR